MSQVIGIASDHGGRILKAHLVSYLKEQGYSVEDFGVAEDASASVDYPDYAAQVASRVSDGRLDKGVLVCGTGIGMSIAANRFSGVRATLVWDEFTATASREHNSSNILCLGERVLNHDRAVDFLGIWLSITQQVAPRHQKRLDKIEKLGLGK